MDKPVYETAAPAFREQVLAAVSQQSAPYIAPHFTKEQAAVLIRALHHYGTTADEPEGQPEDALSMLAAIGSMFGLESTQSGRYVGVRTKGLAAVIVSTMETESDQP